MRFLIERYPLTIRVILRPLRAIDTFNRVFQLIDPKQLNEALAQDGRALIEHVEGQLISLDGKKLRGVSPRSRGTDGLYVLNAWVSDQGLCIGLSDGEALWGSRGRR